MWKHLKLDAMCITDMNVIFSGTSSCDHALEITKNNSQHLTADVLGVKPHTYLYEGNSRCSRARSNLPTTWQRHRRHLSSRRCISRSTTASLRDDRKRGGGGVTVDHTSEATVAKLSGTVLYSIKRHFWFSGRLRLGRVHLHLYPLRPCTNAGARWVWPSPFCVIFTRSPGWVGVFLTSQRGRSVSLTCARLCCARTPAAHKEWTHRQKTGGFRWSTRSRGSRLVPSQQLTFICAVRNSRFPVLKSRHLCNQPIMSNSGWQQFGAAEPDE